VSGRYAAYTVMQKKPGNGKVADHSGIACNPYVSTSSRTQLGSPFFGEPNNHVRTFHYPIPIPYDPCNLNN
jgi:hypothetical protein